MAGHKLKENSSPDRDHNNAMCCDIQPNQPPQSRHNDSISKSDDSINSIDRYTNNNISNTDTYNEHALNMYIIKHIQSYRGE